MKDVEKELSLVREATDAHDKALKEAKTHLRVLADQGSGRSITPEDLARHANVMISCTEALGACIISAGLLQIVANKDSTISLYEKE